MKLREQSACRGATDPVVTTEHRVQGWRALAGVENPGELMPRETAVAADELLSARADRVEGSNPPGRAAPGTARRRRSGA